MEALSGLSAAQSIEDHGFQYASFLIEGGQILAALRVAWDDGDTYHNSNIIGTAIWDMPA